MTPPAARPDIVFVTPIRPSATGNGLAIRAGLFLEGMSRAHSVAVAVGPAFAAGTPLDDLAGNLSVPCTTLESAAPAEALKWPSRLLATPGGRDRAARVYPLPSVCRRPSTKSEARLRELVGGARLVHVMRSYMAPWVDFLIDAEARPVLTLDLDERDSAVQRQLGADEEAERFERLERHYAPAFDAVYTASESETASLVRDCRPRRAQTVPNAARPPLASPSRRAGPGPASPPADHDLLFVGSLSYPPNVEAAEWLCREVRPLLPSVTIALVGSRPAPAVRALAELPRVTVAGDVPDVGPWYAASRVAVAPLRVGGGTRIKIAEALAHGRPVVATPIGASGLAGGEARGIVIAAAPQAFAAECRRLLDDPAAAARLAAAGQAFIPAASDVIALIDQLTRRAISGARSSRSAASGSGPAGESFG